MIQKITTKIPEKEFIRLNNSLVARKLFRILYFHLDNDVVELSGAKVYLIPLKKEILYRKYLPVEVLVDSLRGDWRGFGSGRYVTSLNNRTRKHDIGL